MTILQYPVHISSSGEVSPISDWQGGETDAKIIVRVPPTEEERKAAGRRFIESWRGALKGAPDMTAKEIRAERLEKKYGQ